MEKLIRVSAAVALAIVTTGGMCDPGAASFVRNEDLSRIESTPYLWNLTYPTWNPAGTELYCLSGSFGVSVAGLWAIPSSGDSSFMLRQGEYTAMAMANDGKSFLLAYDIPGSYVRLAWFRPEVESMPYREVNTSGHGIDDVSFSWSGSEADTYYFSSGNELYAGSLLGDSVWFVMDLPSHYFAVGPGDTILSYMSHGEVFPGKPCVHPSGRYVVRPEPFNDSVYFRADVVLTDLQEDVDYTLPARPWYRSAFKYFAWHPDGQSLVVSVCGLTPDPVWPTGEFELWQMANVMTHVGD